MFSDKCFRVVFCKTRECGLHSVRSCPSNADRWAARICLPFWFFFTNEPKTKPKPKCLCLFCSKWVANEHYQDYLWSTHMDVDRTKMQWEGEPDQLLNYDVERLKIQIDSKLLPSCVQHWGCHSWTFLPGGHQMTHWAPGCATSWWICPCILHLIF